MYKPRFFYIFLSSGFSVVSLAILVAKLYFFSRLHSRGDEPIYIFYIPRTSTEREKQFVTRDLNYYKKSIPDFVNVRRNSEGVQHQLLKLYRLFGKLADVMC